jgi:hypothetical protein
MLYLLNTIKPLSGHENSFWQNFKYFSKGGTLGNLNFKILSLQDIKLAQKIAWAKIWALSII